MRVRPVGADALLLEVDDPPAWFAELWRRRAAGELDAVEIVPGARTVLLDGGARPGGDGRAGPCLGAAAAGRGRRPAAWSRFRSSTTARTWPASPSSGASTSRGVDRPAWRHRAAGRVLRLRAGLGVPGRAAGGAGGARDWPRPARGCRPARSRSPDTYAGIYPTASPGGWRLVGRTDVRLFDLDRDPPALLDARHPGAAAVPVDDDRGGPVGPAHHGAGSRPARVRPSRRAAIGCAGPARAAPANRLVGNPDGAAGLETTLTGVRAAGGGRHRRSRSPGRRAGDGSTGSRCRSASAFAVPAGRVVEVGPAEARGAHLRRRSRAG